MSGVLIVEDDIFVALDLEHILLSAELTVCGIATDRKGTIALADQCDVALIDINLQDGATGPSIGKDLATLHGVKVIFVTSHPALVGDAASIAECVITKPFRADMIVDAVRSARDTGCGLNRTTAGFMPPPPPISDIFAES